MSSSKLSSYDVVNKIWRGPTRPSIFNTEAGLGFIILNILKQNPDRVMQVCDDSGAEMTCGEMHSRTVIISNFLSSKTELKQNDVVGIVARNSENIAPVIFACFTLGLPINPQGFFLNTEDLAFMYSKTKPKAIFCDYDTVEKISEILKKIQLEDCKIFTLMEKVDGFEFVDDILSDFDGNLDDFEPPNLPNISTTPLTINSSSGTTGGIKGIIRSHQHWINQLTPKGAGPLGENSTFLATPAPHWSTSNNILLYSVFYQFKRVITSTTLTTDYLTDILERRKITTFFGPTWLFYQINLSRRIFPNLKSLCVGGAVITKDLIENMKKTFPNCVLLTAFASTESDILTIAEVVDDKLDSSGKVEANTEIKIIDDSGKSLGPNQQGQICYKKPIMFDGYFGDPEMTKTAFDSDGWCYTGDVGYFDDGGYIFVIDRVKHMLKFAQIIFTPLEIEKVIDEIEGVLSSCVVGVHDEGNDIIFAFVIKNEKFNLSEKFIENYVNEKVSDAKKIRGGVHFLKEFPLTATGKVKNRKLKEIAEKIFKESKFAYL